jgi:hypothetical protein
VVASTGGRYIQVVAKAGLTVYFIFTNPNIVGDVFSVLSSLSLCLCLFPYLLSDCSKTGPYTVSPFPFVRIGNIVKYQSSLNVSILGSLVEPYGVMIS